MKSIKCVIIGEDLGTVPDEVKAAALKYKIFSYRILWFEKDLEGNIKPPQDFPELAVVCTGTHDMPTLAGYWEEQDFYSEYIEDRIEKVYLDKEQTEPDKASSISHMDLYKNFKEWFISSMPGNKNIPDSKTAKEAFHKLLPGKDDKRWYGIRIINDDVIQC